MRVIYDATRPKGVGTLMSVSGVETDIQSGMGKVALWVLAGYGAWALFNKYVRHGG